MCFLTHGFPLWSGPHGALRDALRGAPNGVLRGAHAFLHSCACSSDYCQHFFVICENVASRRF